LLIVDMQNAFYKIDTVTAGSLDKAIECINAAIGLFRKHQLPVIAVQHMNAEDGLKPGNEDFDVPPSISLLPTDPRIIKTYGNAFNKTGLADQLRALAVDTVIITGFCAEHCVLSTCRGAKDVDLTPILLRGALASAIPERIRFVEEINDAISYGALKAVLG